LRCAMAIFASADGKWGYCAMQALSSSERARTGVIECVLLLSAGPPSLHCSLEVLDIQ
jgi:hypothetical protein